ncbi:MAG: trypsin-like serine protease [Phycisphaerae bacterium]|nr:trypsin-like serine protease [Phycisphaerae bacterium]
MKIRHLIVALGLMGTLLSAAWGQTTAPGQWRRRDDDDRPSRPTRPGSGQTVQEGTTRAPENEANLPENQQLIPPLEDEMGDPPVVDDGGFVRAYQAAETGLVRIYADKDRKAIGFVVPGGDEEHQLIVTNFLALAGTNWIDVRGGEDGAKFEVQGLLNHNEQQDLAIIQVKASDSRKVKPLTLADRNPRPEEVVYAFGLRHRQASDWAGTGKVLGIEQGGAVGGPPNSEWISTEPIIGEGNIGGPLLNREGRVVGLCTSSGKNGRGPYLATPVSQIKALIEQENFGPGRFPTPVGGFRWPENQSTAAETFSESKIRAAIMGLKRTLDCKKCNGFGFLVTPQYRVDTRTGQRTQMPDRRDVCPDCGGAGVVIKPGVQQLISTVAKSLVSPDPKLTEADVASLRSLARESFDRAAVNRKVLADALMPSAERLLADVEKSRGEAVTFLARTGPSLRFQGQTYYCVRPYGSAEWLLVTGSEVRGARAAQPTGDSSRGRRPPGAAPRQSTVSLVMVSGVLQGRTVVVSNKKMYRLPLVEAADIASLRN